MRLIFEKDSFQDYPFCPLRSIFGGFCYLKNRSSNSRSLRIWTVILHFCIGRLHECNMLLLMIWLRFAGGGSKPTHPCMINNGGCEYLCLPKRFGHVCACPDPDNSYLPSSYNTQGAIRGASDAYPYHKSAGVVCSQMEFPRNNKTAVTTTTSPVFGPHGNFPPNDSTGKWNSLPPLLRFSPKWTMVRFRTS